MTDPVPLPEPGTERIEPPDAVEVYRNSRGVLAAVRPEGGHSELQLLLIEAAMASMTGHRIDGAHLEPATADEFASGLAERNLAFRTRVVQTMILGALVLRPLPVDVAGRVAEYAGAASVDDGMLRIAHEFAEGDYGLAAVDFDRNGYTADWSPARASTLQTSTAVDTAWATCVDDGELAARWDALGGLRPDTIGHHVWQFYRARGFEFPGRPGSAPPLLAQHDWVHVLADYGTRVESELEVFAFVARANDDPRGFSLLAMVVSLFESGNLDRAAGLFEASPGQLSLPGMTTRVADAMRRGALSHGFEGRPDVDLLGIDWFALADRPLNELRQAFSVAPKAPAALAAGSVGPWEPGGISEFQDRTGRRAAADAGRPYDAYGARVN